MERAKAKTGSGPRKKASRRLFSGRTPPRRARADSYVWLTGTIRVPPDTPAPGHGSQSPARFLRDPQPTLELVGIQSPNSRGVLRRRFYTPSNNARMAWRLRITPPMAARFRAP